MTAFPLVVGLFCFASMSAFPFVFGLCTGTGSSWKEPVPGTGSFQEEPVPSSSFDPDLRKLLSTYLSRGAGSSWEENPPWPPPTR